MVLTLQRAWLLDLSHSNSHIPSHLAHGQPVLADQEAGEEGLAGGAERVAEGGEEEEAPQHDLVGCVLCCVLGVVWCVGVRAFG